MTTATKKAAKKKVVRELKSLRTTANKTAKERHGCRCCRCCRCW